MSEKRTLLKGGYVLTMDDSIGDLELGDVLIEGSRIAAVAPRLEAAADEVLDVSGTLVLPGLIDTHLHLWQSPLRGLASETWAGEYFLVVHPLSGRYSSSDMRIATHASAIELLSNGVTTVVDFCHSVNSPEHADASVDALEQAGIRALFAYSFRDRPEVATRAFQSHAERVADAGRVRNERLASDDALVRMAIALNNIDHVDAETNAREVRCGRELGVFMTVHTIRPGQIALLGERGHLGPDLQWVHATSATDYELGLLAEQGGSISATPECEVGYEGLYPMTGRCVRHGVQVAFGVDIVSVTAGNLLNQLRVAFLADRHHDAQAGRFEGREPSRDERTPTLTARKVLKLATIDAAATLGLADRTGSLTPGKEADVLVLSTEPWGLGLGDPAAHVILQSSARDVSRVYVAGRERVRNGELVDVDVARMRKELDEVRERMVGDGTARAAA